MRQYLARTACSMAIVALVVLPSSCKSRDNYTQESAAAISPPSDSTSLLGGKPEYTTSQFLGLLNAANDGEIESARLASTKAVKATVKTFARDLERDHKAMKAMVDSTAQQLGVTPVLPGVDDDVMKKHQESMPELTAKTNGKDFELAFLDYQIDLHKKVIDEVEDAIKDNRYLEMTPLLQQALQGLKTHLDRAELLKKEY